MAEYKFFTDTIQSQNLLKMISPSGSDLSFYVDDDGCTNNIPNNYHHDLDHEHIPSWSLSALIEELPKKIGDYYMILAYYDNVWHCDYMSDDGDCKYNDVCASNPLDACYNMIVRLYEENLMTNKEDLRKEYQKCIESFDYWKDNYVKLKSSESN